MKTLLHHCTLYSPALGVVEDAALQIDGSVIAYAGASGAAPDFAAERVVNAEGKLAMPGLINAHTHLPMTLMRGRADDLPLQEWLTDAIFPAEDKLTDEDIYWGSLLAIAEMLATGTTACADMYLNQRPLVRAAHESGIRLLTGRAVTADDGRRLREALELFEACDGAANGRIRVGMMAHAEYATTPEQLCEIAAVAGRLGAPTHIHASETQREHAECVARHGVTPVGLLQRTGMLDTPLTLAHGVWITPEDQAMLANANCVVAHCPGSNCKLGSGIAPVTTWLRGGVAVALGTDGAASNNSLSMWREMYLMSLLAKGSTRTADALSAEQLLSCVLQNGARAVGAAGEVGELSAGYKADVILVDTTGLGFLPGGSLLSNLVYSNCAGGVTMTMVDGEIVYEDGKFLTLDIWEVAARAKECSDRLYR